MISVLIPIYNRDVVELVKGILLQFDSLKIDFEINCLEDGSDPEMIEKNRKLKTFKNINYFISESNQGRIKSRQKLSKIAIYPWLLFLDADVKIKHPDFVKDYIESTKSGFDTIFGGFAYFPDPPAQKFLLRWKYGQEKEEVPAIIRNKKPYKIVISANYLIKKSVFDNIYGKIEHNGYGYDNFFGALLKENKVKVLHIDNEVYHLGIEESKIYLKKIEQAVEALVNLYLSGNISEHQNDLLRFFTIIKSKNLDTSVRKIFLYTRNMVKKNLLGKNPSIYLLQFYKIGYMCDYNYLKG